MAQNVTQRFPFSNKGVVQKIDINQLQDGQYSFLLNTVSEQEGSLSPRYGHTNIGVGAGGTNGWTPSPPSAINTLHVTQVGATAEPTFFLSEGRNIHRKVSSTSSSSYERLAYEIITANKRIGIATYKTDQVGTNGMTYFATGYNGYDNSSGAYTRGMLRNAVSGPAASNTAKYWGILPPAKPAEITPSAVTIKSILTSTSSGGIDLTAATRVTSSISSSSEEPAAGSKFWKIVLPAPISAEWLPGMYIVDGSPTPQESVIEKVDKDGYIYAYFASQPVSPLTAKQTAALAPVTPGDSYSAMSGTFSPNIDLSFGQTNAMEGYVSDDTVVLSFYTSTPEKIYDIRFRLYVGGSDADYYEKAISPGVVQAMQNAAAIDNSTYDPTNADRSSDENGYSTSVTNPVIPTGTKINYDITQVGLNPAYLSPSKAGVGGWSQVEISKRSFLAVNKAASAEGGGSRGWGNISKVEVLVRPITTTDVVSFKLGGIFAYGGKGVNSNYSAKLTPYTYVYTYKDSTTGAESNPSIDMIPDNALNVVRQGINVNVLGTSTSDFQSFSSQVDKICIYRAGGTFTDGLYRRVGVITNPGGATTANFVDTADDLSIAGAPIAEFDNDAPITSDIGKEYKYDLGADFNKANNPVSISLAGVSSGLTDILTPGTIVNIGGGIAGSTGKQESCVVLSVSAGSFSTYIQYDHKQNEAVIWDTNAGIAGDVICAAFNRMWVAGDPKNPHMLYSSKTGRPEAFPVINQGTGNPHVLAVSSPDNPINGIAEFNGELVCLCQNGIYTVRLDNGRMVGPFKTPANRGLTLKYAWGYVDNEIWFLSNDGIYAWGGGAIRKVTFAIDFVFNNKTVNGISPFKRDSSDGPSGVNYYSFCNIQQKGNEVFFNYINAEGWFYVLRYHILFDRWSVDEVYDPNSNVTRTSNGGVALRPVSITAMAADKANNKLYAAKTITTSGPTYTAYLIDYDVVGVYRDGVTNPANPNASGTSIYYEVKTKFYDMAASLVKKNFTDIGIEYTSGSTDFNNDPVTDNTFNYKIFYDYSTPLIGATSLTSTDNGSAYEISEIGTTDFTLIGAASNTVGISFIKSGSTGAGTGKVTSITQGALPNTSTGRQIAEFPLQQYGSPITSAGREARAAMFSIWGVSKAYNTFHNFAYTFIPLSEIIKGRVTDWDDLGHPFDKRLFNLTIEYDNNNTELVLYLDTIGGLNSASTTLAAQTITLAAKSGRAKSSIPITADIVAKMVRLRPKVATVDYQIFNYSFQKEDYPRDIINNTDWSDLGHPYEKRLYQLYINCDTSGNNVSVAIEADGGATPLQTVTVNGSSNNRMQAFPLNKDLIGKLIRLKVTSLPSNTKFQLFDFKFDYEKFPQPTVLSTPWTDFGYDYLKYAEQISFDVNTCNDPVPAAPITVPVSIYGDGAFKQTVQVTGTQADRNQIITLNPALTFRTMRLEVGTIPAGGRFQLWDYRPIFRPADKGEVYHTFDWDDLQYPYDKKLTEVTIEFETGASDDVKIALDTLSGLDGTTLTSAFQTLTLPNTNGSRGFKTFAINETICKMIRIRAIGSGNPTASALPASFKMYGYKFGNVTQYPPDIVFFTDWSDLGYQYEKRFYQLFLNCDTNGYDVTVNIEADGDSFGISSIASYGGFVRINSSAVHYLSNGDKVYIKGVTGSGASNVNGTWIVTVISTTSFMLNNSTFTGSPTGGTAYKILQQVVANATTTNRMLTFAMDKDLIGKLVRLNIINIPAGGKFQLFDYKFDYENLPKPIILSTPWTDFGYDYLKYAEQIAFDINTNGVQIPVDIYCDGAWKQRVIVEGTQQSRNFNCTLNPAITFQTMRLQINPDQIPDGGRFQLWEYKPVFRPADKGPVYHTFDWDNLDHPYDKKISEVTIEFETNGKDVVVVLDTLTGINGNTENLAVQSFTLNSSGRGYKTFPIPETICKMVRIRALSTGGRNNRLDPDFKMWGYRFGNTVPYPPDIQRFSEWTDLDYPCDKIFRGVGLSIDTGGVNCTVTLEVDGVVKQTFTVNTTSAARQTFLTAQNSTEIIGKMYRLTFTPGAGGKAQVFGAPQFNTVKDSCPFVFLDSYEQGLGSAGYSVLKQFWADYKCEGSITIKFYNEYNVLFYSKTLGAHASRDVERFYLPSINGSVINKSKKHRITIEAVDPTKPFKWYRDTSRLEYINLSSDQRQGYFQFIPWTNMQLPV